MWLQKEISLKARPRGFHLITQELLRELPELSNIRVGMMNIFIMHTSASLTLNEVDDLDFSSNFSLGSALFDCQGLYPTRSRRDVVA